MSSLAGALDESAPRSSQIPLKREDYDVRHDSQDFEMQPAGRVKQEHPLKQELSVKLEDSKLKAQGEDVEMDDLFGNDEDVEEVQPFAYVFHNDLYLSQPIYLISLGLPLLPHLVQRQIQNDYLLLRGNVGRLLSTRKRKSHLILLSRSRRQRSLSPIYLSLKVQAVT